MWIMARTSTLQKFGYGLLVLYAGGIVALAVAVCADLPGLFRGRNGEDQRRAEMQNGRMLILSPDRGQCRSIRFNNETAQLSAETLTDCSDQRDPDVRSGGVYGAFRNGFAGR
jgi:hypothetical protein